MINEDIERKIDWRQWSDPMGVDDEDENEGYDDSSFSSKTYRVRPAALTNFGIIPINPNNDPAKNFNLWVGHATFYIGDKAKEIILNTPGVEIFKDFSPYRFLISIGLAFDTETVKKNIVKQLVNYYPKKLISEEELGLDDDLKTILQAAITEVDEKNEYWVAYILPNSEIEVSTPKTQEDFFKHKKILKTARDMAGGIVLSSDAFGV